LRWRHDHFPAGLYRNRHRLLDQHVQAQIQRLAHYFVVHRRVGHHVHRPKIGDLSHHLFEIVENRGPEAQKVLRFPGGQLGVFAANIAESTKLYIVKRRPRQLAQTIEVTRPHATAAHQSEFYFIGHLTLLYHISRSTSTRSSSIWR
jgi:hypothetical protein